MNEVLEMTKKEMSTNDLCLIKGEFDIEQASDIVRELILCTVNFNKLQNLCSQVRFDNEDDRSLHNIRRLENTLIQFNQIKKEAINRGQRLQIKSTIQIELV
jgi:hypothetical protein